VPRGSGALGGIDRPMEFLAAGRRAVLTHLRCASTSCATAGEQRQRRRGAWRAPQPPPVRAPECSPRVRQDEGWDQDYRWEWGASVPRFDIAHPGDRRDRHRGGEVASDRIETRDGPTYDVVAGRKNAQRDTLEAPESIGGSRYGARAEVVHSGGDQQRRPIPVPESNLVDDEQAITGFVPESEAVDHDGRRDRELPADHRRSSLGKRVAAGEVENRNSVNVIGSRGAGRSEDPSDQDGAAQRSPSSSRATSTGVTPHDHLLPRHTTTLRAIQPPSRQDSRTQVILVCTDFYTHTAEVAREKCLIFCGSPHIDPDSAGFRSVPLSQVALTSTRRDVMLPLGYGAVVRSIRS